MPEATACPPSVVADTIMRTIELGVTITDAAVDEKQTTILCSPVARDPRCPDCGADRQIPRHRDPAADRSAGRWLSAGVAGSRAPLPLSDPTVWRCGVQSGPGHVGSPTIVDDAPLCPILRRLMIDRTTVSAIAAELGVCWHTVSSIAMRATADLIAAAGPDRLAGVRVIGVDEHRWAPRRRGPKGSSR